MKDVPAELSCPFYAQVGQMLGMKQVHTRFDLIERVDRGVSVHAVEKLQIKARLSNSEISRLIAPRRILMRRLAAGLRLTTRQADMAIRIARVVVNARQVFANGFESVWLREPNVSMGGRVPLEMLTYEVGSIIVEEHLTAISEGIFV